MKTEIVITNRAIEMCEVAVDGCGAVARFDGIVRGREGECDIAGLVYEAYAGMAERMIDEILRKLADEWPVELARVHHRVGFVPVGESAIVVEIQSRHRAEAFSVLAGFMDRLKVDVPIWKVGSLEKSARPASGGDRVLEIDETRELIAGRVSELESERVKVADAPGRVVVEAVRAAFDQPPFDQSAVDGFALGPVVGDWEIWEVGETIFAGGVPGAGLVAGQCARVLTGAPVPDGTRAVVKQEDCEIDGGRVRVAVKDGDFVRARGGAFAIGDVVLDAGVQVGAGALALLASAGIGDVVVRQIPRVLHIVTGDEVVPGMVSPAAGKIADSNGPMIAALLRAGGAEIETRHTGDDLRDLRELVGKFDGDLLLISGGAGPGDRDHTRSVLAECGFGIHFSRVNSRPGRPMIFATRGRQIAFGLPGNPLSHFVCYHGFVRVALARLGGVEVPDFRMGWLVDAAVDSGADGRPTWSPAVVTVGDRGYELRAQPWKHSGDLSPLAVANALVLGGPDEDGRVQFLAL